MMQIGDVGDETGGHRRCSGAAGWLDGAGQLTDVQRRLVANRKYLSQHVGCRWVQQRVFGRQRRSQLGGAFARVGKNHIEELEADAVAVELAYQSGHQRTWPGPGAEGGQTGVVDVDHHDAAFDFRLGTQAPDQVGATLVDHVQRRRK